MAERFAVSKETQPGSGRPPGFSVIGKYFKVSTKPGALRPS
jgi:hypothetical protein